MEKLTRRRYTLEYKQEAVRLVSSGQKVAAAAKALGIVEQTLANWVKAEGAAMKYAWIERNKLLWPVCVQCRILSVSASGYRQHLEPVIKLAIVFQLLCV
jgi:putative transposase